MANGNEAATGSGMKWLWWVLGILAVLFLLSLLFMGGDDTATTGTGGPDPTLISAADIAQNPEAFDGQMVTAGGEVTRMVGERMMLLSSGSAEGSAGVVVISQEPLSAQVGQTVAVTGAVRVGPVQDVLAQVNFPLPQGFEDFVAGLGERPVLMAETVEQ